MGIEKLAEEAAGIFAAEKALAAVDPNAGFIAKAAAAVAGYEGVNKITDLLGGSSDQATEQPAADAQDDQSGN